MSRHAIETTIIICVGLSMILLSIVMFDIAVIPWIWVAAPGILMVVILIGNGIYNLFKGKKK